jgi:ribosomal protein S18 acetylase RimI-like enzyme
MIEISTDRDRQDIDAVHRLLQSTHWATWMSREVVAKAIANSLCFGMFDDGEQIGFARLVTDSCTYAYLTDVVIDAKHRGRGLGTRLMAALFEHPEVRDLRRVALLTVDAMKLYEKFDCTTDTGKLTYMERRRTSA